VPNRRRFLQSVSGLPVLGSLPFSAALLPPPESLEPPPKRDYFRELGVRPFINAAGLHHTDRLADADRGGWTSIRCLSHLQSGISEAVSVV